MMNMNRICFNFGFINLGAVILLAIGRNITTEFAESKYIAMSMVSIFQSLLIGTPLLQLSKGSANCRAFCSVLNYIHRRLFNAYASIVPKIMIMRKGEEGSPICSR